MRKTWKKLNNKQKLISKFIAKFLRGDYPHQRLGQAFINVFNINDNAELFYIEDQEEALFIIINNYFSNIGNENDYEH